MSTLRNRAIEGLRPGDAFTVTRTFTEKDVLWFGDISRDYNPVRCTLTITEIDDKGVAEARVDCRNEEDETVLEGVAPNPRQKEIMKATRPTSVPNRGGDRRWDLKEEQPW
jgi:hypothetical protein